MAAAVAVTVFVGFAPTFYLRDRFKPGNGLSILLHVHGFALSAWIILFLVQTILIARGSPILLVEAAAVRIAAFHVIHEPRYLMLSQYSSALLFFIPCFAFDWATRRKLHPANIVGLSLILMDLTIQPIILAWGPWTNFANAIQRLVV